MLDRLQNNMPHFDTNNLPWIDYPDANVQGYIRDNVDPTEAEVDKSKWQV